MRRITYKFVLFLFFICLAIVYIIRLLNISLEHEEQRFQAAREKLRSTTSINAYKLQHRDKIVISFVVCDSRFNESINVVKSIVLFTRLHVHFVIFTDDVLWVKFNETLNKMKALTNNRLGFELQKIHFPEPNREDWLNLFSKCAAQRLFIPKLIPHIDAMIYVDTDTLFLGPVEELWNYFTRFNSSQISAMALEDDNPNVSWYPRFAKHPFYGKYGLNSGVMLMNLTRMREFGWTDYVTPIMLKWKLYIPWGDQSLQSATIHLLAPSPDPRHQAQSMGLVKSPNSGLLVATEEFHYPPPETLQDIINIIFHYHERAVYQLSCRYNFRPDQCMYGDACADATSEGVFLLHGSRKAFHNNKQPAFQAIYRSIDEYELGTDPSKTLLASISRYITESATSNCGNLKASFLRVPTNTFRHLYSLPDR